MIHAIKNMNSKTSIDPSGISNKMLKYSGPILKERLLELFNECLLVKRVPKNWKHSEITMLLKPGQDASIVNSYRPIRMTSCIARLFERMVLSRLQQFLKNNNLIIKNQSGFRKSRQTRDNLFHLIQKSQESFNKEEKILAIFFDVAADFDKVWHQGHKANAVNCFLNNKTRSYTDRILRVRVSNIVEEPPLSFASDDQVIKLTDRLITLVKLKTKSVVLVLIVIDLIIKGIFYSFYVSLFLNLVLYLIYLLGNKSFYSVPKTDINACQFRGKILKFDNFLR